MPRELVETEYAVVFTLAVIALVLVIQIATEIFTKGEKR